MMSQRMAVDDWRAMIDETEAQSDAEPRPDASGLRAAPDWQCPRCNCAWCMEARGGTRASPDASEIAAVRKAIKKAWLVHGEKTDLDADNLALAAIDALAQSDAEPFPYPGGRTKAEWDVIARASYERAKDLPDD